MRERQLELTAGPAGWVRAHWRLEAPPGQRSRWQEAYFRLTKTSDDPDAWKVVEMRTFDHEAYQPGTVPWAGRIANAVNASTWLQEQLLNAIGDDVPHDIREAFRGAKRGRGPLRRLERPAGRRLGPEFYQQVAEVYQDAVSRGLSPRKRMQEDTDAAQDTVASWIKRARKLGYLPKASPGKVSA
jgi:hypothetical protein